MKVKATESTWVTRLHVEGRGWTVDQVECGIEEFTVNPTDKMILTGLLRTEWYGKSVFGENLCGNS